MKRLPWFTVPAVILLVAIGLAGTVLYRIVTRPDRSNVNTAPAANANATENRSCGNGVCETVACLSLDCPPPESAATCPADCADADGPSTDSPPADDENINTNSATPAALNFSTTTQTLEAKADCPVEEANLTPADAVRVAAAAGFKQGNRAVEVNFAMSDAPLSQCVWSVKNWTSESGGRLLIVVDATQDVYRSTSWGT